MRHIRVSLVIPVAVLALTAAACGGGGGNLSGGSVAKVGSVTITKSDFDQLFDRAKQNYKINGQTFPKAGTEDYDRLKQQAAQFLVQRSEFDQEADKLGVKVTQNDIDQRLGQYKKQYFGGSEKKYQAQLKKQGLTQEQVDSDIKDRLISEKLFAKVTEGVNVSDKDVANYYDSHISQYRRPESRTVRHILISVCGPSTPKGAKCLPDAKAKTFANKLYDRVKAGENFAALAKKYSQDPGSASQGGKLTITRGQTVAPFDQTAFLLGVGTVSRPVKTEYGYHLIMPISAVSPAKTTPLKQVRTAIKEQLLVQKKQEDMAKWANGLTKKYHVKYADGYKPTSTTTPTATTGATTAVTTSAATTSG
jgi:foldase protein PrsA